MLSENLLLRIARACYAACNSWDTDHNSDAEMPAWDDADDAVKESILKRINKILHDPRAGDATFHNEWLSKQKAEGWSSGPRYDEAKKVDPLCTPFHLLPPEMQARERLFRAVTLSLSRV